MTDLYPSPTVDLISYTNGAASLLRFVKNTRLEMDANNINVECDVQKEAEELQYIANTIRSSWEFVDYVFLIRNVSRAFTHQFVRTRTASFAQQSLRVVDPVGVRYSTDGDSTRRMKAIVPERFRHNSELYLKFDIAMRDAEDSYRYLIASGASTEDARGVLPTNVATNICAKFNLRNFADLVSSRSGGRTQNEYRVVVEKMADAVLEVHPWTKDFLYANHDRDYFQEIEAFAEEQFGGDVLAKGKLLKIVDKMRGVK